MNIKKISLVLLSALIIILTWPIFAAWFPALAKPWWWYPIGVLIGTIYVKDFFKNSLFVYLILYTMVILINSISGDRYIYDPFVVFIRFCALFFIITSSFIFLKNTTEFSFKMLFIVFMLLLVYTTIVSFILNNQFPEVVRNDVTITGASDTYEFSYLYKYGLTRYQFAHAIPILIPPLVMAYRGKKNAFMKKLFFAFLVIICIVHSYVSGSTTTFMMAIIATIMSLAVVTGSTKKNVSRLIILSIFLLPLLNNTFLSYFLEWIDSIVGNEGVIHEHLIDLQRSILSERAAGDVVARQDLYDVSWKSFLSNPFIGTNSSMGNHSVFMDHLGAFGLIGFIPFVAFLWNGYKYVTKSIGKKYKYYYLICFLCAIGMMAFKNVNIWSICCFLYVAAPVLFIQLSNEQKE